MKLQKLISLAATLALTSLNGWSAAVAATADIPAPAPPQAMVPQMNLSNQLSHQAQEVVKLVSSGIPNDVVKAYIENAPSTFNLSSDNIIRLQQSGISGVLLTGMLEHDRNLRLMATMPAGAQAYPPTGPYEGQTPTDSGYDNSAQEQPDPDSYNQLAPYGDWSYLPSYGWGWQPYAGLGYGYYPWAALGVGFWWNCPGHGWCWFPHSCFSHVGFHSGFHGDFHSGFHAGFHSGFHSGSVHSSSFDRSVHGSSSWGHSSSSFSHASPGFHSGYSGSVHSYGGSMGGMSHASGGGGHMGGGFSGGHGGGGGGGGHH